MLGALIRKYWPGLYQTGPDDEAKLATKWADYEAAPSPPFETAADAVITTFWVTHIFRIPFIVNDPTVITHDSQFFYAWLKRFYRVLDQQAASSILHAHCVRLTRQQFYNQKFTSANDFTYEKTGKRAKKADNAKNAAEMTKEEYISVSKLSMEFYIAAKLPLHLALLELHFQVMPDWADGKEDAWDALVRRWVGEDEDFSAVSQRNKANRGSEGTHSAGNRNHFLFKDKMVYIYMERRAFIFTACFYLV